MVDVGVGEWTECTYGSKKLFPLGKSASKWKSCNDKTELAWIQDAGRDLVGLDTADKLKMARSMGFCPHFRCQLQNFSYSIADGLCPMGLCYTKVDNGTASAGGCCYRNGTFLTQKLVGYYYKSQGTPKPIYTHSRIVLGNSIGAEDHSKEGFINANILSPGLIATQCPLANRPQNFENTIDDVKRMILDQSIAMWVQLAPSVTKDWKLLTPLSEVFASSLSKERCGVFPIEFFWSQPDDIFSKGVSNFRFNNINPYTNSLATVPYVNITYTISGFVKTFPDGSKKTVFEKPVQESIFPSSSSPRSSSSSSSSSSLYSLSSLSSSSSLLSSSSSSLSSSSSSLSSSLSSSSSSLSSSISPMSVRPDLVSPPTHPESIFAEEVHPTAQDVLIESRHRFRTADSDSMPLTIIENHTDAPHFPSLDFSLINSLNVPDVALSNTASAEGSMPDFTFSSIDLASRPEYVGGGSTESPLISAAASVTSTVTSTAASVTSTITSTAASVTSTVTSAAASLTSTASISDTADSSVTDPSALEIGWEPVSVDVVHIWYHRWEDFMVPPSGDEAVILALASDAARVVQQGQKVAINCMSGRGRTGTFAAVVDALVNQVDNVPSLVNRVVSMRENRDNIVETPAQFRFAARTLGLRDTGLCEFPNCFVDAIATRLGDQPDIIPSFICGVLLALLFFVGIQCCMLKKGFISLNSYKYISVKSRDVSSTMKPGCGISTDESDEDLAHTLFAHEQGLKPGEYSSCMEGGAKRSVMSVGASSGSLLKGGGGKAVKSN